MGENHKVATSKGRIYHCPDKHCKGLVYLDSFPMFARKVGCLKCRIEVCSSCREQWHEGIKCSKEDGTELKWDAIGNPIQSKVSRCPGCKAPFEKISGCPHMNCMICKYEWCWNCGSNWRSPIHKGGGGIFCELFSRMR